MYLFFVVGGGSYAALLSWSRALLIWKVEGKVALRIAEILDREENGDSWGGSAAGGDGYDTLLQVAKVEM